MRVVCECDGDLVGDPPHWIRSNPSTLCLEHDMCCVCDEAKAVILVDGDKCCRDCALEEVKVCPNCGWDAGFTWHYSTGRESHGETHDEEWLTCCHCGKETDEAEVERVNAERLADIKQRLETVSP